MVGAVVTQILPQLDHQGIEAPLGHPGTQTQAFPQLAPGGTSQHAPLQQEQQAGLQAAQPLPQPSLPVGFAAGGLRRMIGPAGMGPIGGRQQVHQEQGGVLPGEGGSIEAAQLQGMVQVAGLAPTLRAAAESLGQACLRQGRQLPVQALLLQELAAAMQLPQLARATQRRMLIPQVMLHRALDVGHRVAAQGVVPAWIEGLDRPDQPEAAQLHQVFERQAGVLALAGGHPPDQGQVPFHQMVAQAQIAALPVAAQQVGVVVVRRLRIPGVG